MKKNIMILLVISLINQGLTAFFAFVPNGMMWVYAMIIPLINAVIYLISFFLLLKDGLGKKEESYNIPSSLMILFIPVYLYSAINISSVGDSLFLWVSVCTGIYVSTLSILMIIFRNKKSKLYNSPFKKCSIILLIICAVITFITYLLESYYYSMLHDGLDDKGLLFNVPLYVYISVLLIYIIFVIIVLSYKRVKYKKEEQN
ncbi:MAG: hypothetical protein IJS58_02545 [Bacilli bacterium]|nr:hypothetical protein [Bacilli bacterium]